MKNLLNLFRTYVPRVKLTRGTQQRSLETFQVKESPHPSRRGQFQTVRGLAALPKRKFQLDVNGRILPRLWNCDMVAALNMKAAVMETIDSVTELKLGLLDSKILKHHSGTVFAVSL